MEAVERWRPTPGLNMIEYIDRGSLKMADIPQQAALMIEIEGDAELDMTGALESESWLATSAADRERLRLFRHSFPEKANERIRRTGFVKLGTDYAVPLDKNREMLAIYRRVMDQEAPGRYIIFAHMTASSCFKLRISTFMSGFQPSISVSIATLLVFCASQLSNV